MTTTTPTIWTLPRSSNEWVGPITVTITDELTGAPVSDPIFFAVLPKGQRPPVPGTGTPPAPWAAPAADPDPTGNIGVTAAPVDCDGVWGIWLTVIGTSEQPVLEPSEVGWVIRT